MARTAQETAKVLSDIYDESFDNDSYEQFQVGWPELRSIAGVQKLTTTYLNQVDKHLRDLEMLLVVCDSFLLVARQLDLSHARSMPARLIEQYLPDAEELVDPGDDIPEDEDDSF
ncbi:MAG: hypothetical protein LWW87_14760 [Geobacteraceae bacterium]|nr:hypothetical protein [Geobacteraceae bacterium]